MQWYFDHDVTALPHLFRVLWLFWQMGDRMPEGRQWIDQLRLRADELSGGEQAELLFNAAVTAVEVGDDDSALAAVETIREFDGQVGDPTLDSALQLAVSWTLPILDDFDGAVAGGDEGACRTPALERSARVVRIADCRHARDDAGPG